MTPPLLATRDALAEVLHDAMCMHDFGDYRECEKKADALLASGVVRDPATLADDVNAAKAEALLEAANEWTQGAWADTPRRADRVADRIAAAQYAGDWLRARAAALTEDPS